MSKATLRTLFISLVLITLAGVGLGFMVSTTMQRATVLESQIEALRTERTQEVAFRRLQTVAEETVDERAQLKSHFLSRESESIDLLNLVEGMAPRGGVVLSTTNLTQVTDPADQSQWIEVTFEFLGEQARVERFLSVLENLPYVTRVMSAELQAQSSTQWEAIVTLRVRIYAYEESN